MSPILRIIVASGALAALAGCAAHPEPIVDMQGVDRAAFERDRADCAEYAGLVSPAEGSAKGAAVGAAVGAATGAISGEVAQGAGYGGIYGATRSGLEAARDKQAVFKRCLQGRGYRVLN